MICGSAWRNTSGFDIVRVTDKRNKEDCCVAVTFLLWAQTKQQLLIFTHWGKTLTNNRLYGLNETQFHIYGKPTTSNCKGNKHFKAT